MHSCAPVSLRRYAARAFYQCNNYSEVMKLLVLSVCIMATAMVAYGETIVDIALHGGSVSTEDVQQCSQNANLAEADLMTTDMVKDGSYKNPENEERAKKNGCFIFCVLQKRGLIVDNEIQKEKLYAKSQHSHLNPGTQAKIYATVDTCVEQVKTTEDMCNKSLSLITCLWKDFI